VESPRDRNSHERDQRQVDPAPDDSQRHRHAQYAKDRHIADKGQDVFRRQKPWKKQRERHKECYREAEDNLLLRQVPDTKHVDVVLREFARRTRLSGVLAPFFYDYALADAMRLPENAPLLLISAINPAYCLLARPA
jgi:hypothetical protein